MTFYVAPRFLKKLSVHITKNFIDLPTVKVPLILGIHGRKDEGKTFQCELVYQKMGVEVVHISAGELKARMRATLRGWCVCAIERRQS